MLPHEFCHIWESTNSKKLEKLVTKIITEGDDLPYGDCVSRLLINPNLPLNSFIDLLQFCIDDDYPIYTLESVIEDCPKTPKVWRLLHKLCGDSHAHCILSHEDCPKTIIAGFCRRKNIRDWEGVDAVAQNPNTSSKSLVKLYDNLNHHRYSGKNFYQRRKDALLNHPNFPPELKFKYMLEA